MTAKKSAAKPRVLIVKDPREQQGRLKMLGGSMSDDWNNVLAKQTSQTLWTKHSDEQTLDTQLAAFTGCLVGIQPRDELEGMVASQLIASHSAAMECYRRAMLGEQSFEGRRENLNQANKLSRTYATLLEALNRHRGKGQQRVTVERVHVHSGGQAIVGVVDQPGGGEQQKSEDQPHAKQIAHAPQQAMPSSDAEGEQVPSSSDAERSLSDARGDVTGGSEG